MQRFRVQASRVRMTLAPAVLMTMVLAGCAGQPRMASVWKDPSYVVGPVQKVLVVALRRDPVRRRLWEDAFTREMGLRGVGATASYQLFPDAPPDTQDVIDAVRTRGCDAVIVSVSLPNEATSTYIPSMVHNEPVTRQDYYGRFHTFWREVREPGHMEVDQIIRTQTDVWATGSGGRLIWSGTLQTLESLGDQSVHSAVASNIAPALESQGIIPKRK